MRVNKTNFHMKGFALGLALKQRRKATRKSRIDHGLKCAKTRWFSRDWLRKFLKDLLHAWR